MTMRQILDTAFDILHYSVRTYIWSLPAAFLLIIALHHGSEGLLFIASCYIGFMGWRIVDFKDMAAEHKAKATSNSYDYDAAMFEISELVRVAVTNREGLDDFISWNFPKEKAAALARKEGNQ